MKDLQSPPEQWSICVPIVSLISSDIKSQELHGLPTRLEFLGVHLVVTEPRPVSRHMLFWLNQMSRKFGARRVTTPRTGCSCSENNGEVTKVVLILDTNFLTSPYPGPKVVTQPTSNYFSVTRFL